MPFIKRCMVCARIKREESWEEPITGRAELQRLRETNIVSDGICSSGCGEAWRRDRTVEWRSIMARIESTSRQKMDAEMAYQGAREKLLELGSAPVIESALAGGGW